jgi:hypothetical protein
MPSAVLLEALSTIRGLQGCLQKFVFGWTLPPNRHRLDWKAFAPR